MQIHVFDTKVYDEGVFTPRLCDNAIESLRRMDFGHCLSETKILRYATCSYDVAVIFKKNRSVGPVLI